MANNIDTIVIEDSEYLRCSAYCTAAFYAQGQLLAHLQATDNATHFRSGNVIHRSFGHHKGDVFYFSYGCVIMWGLSQAEEQDILLTLKPYESAPVETFESELTRYVVGQVAKISKDYITLPSDDIVTKLAFSHGLAQSVKLNVFEKLIERRIEHIRFAPESLALHGRIPMSRNRLSKMMGQIILDRNSINLHTDILDTPEFFWEYSDLEPLYRMIAQDLDISARVSVLNKRLDIVKELFEMLSNELENRHSASLEWIIIFLILVEVLLTLAKDIFKII